MIKLVYWWNLWLNLPQSRFSIITKLVLNENQISVKHVCSVEALDALKNELSSFWFLHICLSQEIIREPVSPPAWLRRVKFAHLFTHTHTHTLNTLMTVNTLTEFIQALTCEEFSTRWGIREQLSKINLPWWQLMTLHIPAAKTNLNPPDVLKKKKLDKTLI